MSEIIKIGNAAKWCGTYKNDKPYYKENLTTLCGCLFSCKIAKAIEKPPVTIINPETGAVQLANTDVWDCLINAIEFYNRALNGIPFDNKPTEGSNNGITSGGVFQAFLDFYDSIESTFMKSKVLTEEEYNELVERGMVKDDIFYMITK